MSTMTDDSSSPHDSDPTTEPDVDLPAGAEEDCNVEDSSPVVEPAPPCLTEESLGSKPVPSNSTSTSTASSTSTSNSGPSNKKFPNLVQGMKKVAQTKAAQQMKSRVQGAAKQTGGAVKNLASKAKAEAQKQTSRIKQAAQQQQQQQQQTSSSTTNSPLLRRRLSSSAASHSSQPASPHQRRGTTTSTSASVQQSTPSRQTTTRAGEYPTLVDPRLPPSSTRPQAQQELQQDVRILWAVVLSIALDQGFRHWTFLQQQFFATSSTAFVTIPLPVALSWILLAFVFGLEVDGRQLIIEAKLRFLGITTTLVDGELEETSHPHMMNMYGNEDAITTKGIAGHRLWSRNNNALNRIFRRRQVQLHRFDNDPTDIIATSSTRTALDRKPRRADVERLRQQLDKQFVQRLSHFRRGLQQRGTAGMGQQQPHQPQQTEPQSSYPERNSNITTPSQHTLGSHESQDSAMASDSSLPVIEPMCSLRGMDVFRTDAPEAVLGDHPFLIQHGLREVPTLMIHIFTMWGSVLIYFEFPSWFNNWDDDDCLSIHADRDASDVKALKKFLRGTDEYRKEHLKVAFDFVQAPYPIRLLAPKDVELQVHRPGKCESTYTQHNGDSGACPLLEVTLDMVGNSTIRGMASLVKRSLTSMALDLALVVSSDGEEEACLGLWRMDHLDVSQYPELPDRFGSNTVAADSLRAERLMSTTTTTTTTPAVVVAVGSG